MDAQGLLLLLEPIPLHALVARISPWTTPGEQLAVQRGKRRRRKILKDIEATASFKAPSTS